MFDRTSLALYAQTGTGSLKGKITDKKSGEPLPFVNIVVESSGTQVTGGATDFDGDYFIKPIDPGTYDVVVSYVGYQPYKQTGRRGEQQHHHLPEHAAQFGYRTEGIRGGAIHCSLDPEGWWSFRRNGDA